MRDAQSRLLNQGIQTCRTPRESDASFVVVVELDARDRITRTWRLGNTPLAICVEKFMHGRELIAPARAPFFVSFQLSFAP